MDHLRTLIDELRRKYEEKRTPGYFYWPLPSALDEEITQIAREFLGLSSEARDEVRARLAPLSNVLRVYAERMAILAVRENSSERLLNGLVAIVIEDFQPDDRETLKILSLLYHSGRKISVDVDDYFEKAAQLATPVSAKLLRLFAHNPQPIETMNYVEATDETGFLYERKVD